MTEFLVRGPRTLLLALACLLALGGCDTQSIQLLPRGQQPATAQRPAQPPAQARPGAPAVPEIRLPGAPVNEYRVAFLAPLSGADGDLGRDLLDAAQLAVAELAGDDFVLLPFDTAGAGGARVAAEAALNEGAQLILGPVFAAEVQAAAPVARARGVSLVSFSNTPEVAGDGVYVMGIVPRQQVTRVVAYAAQNGGRRFAALAPSTPYGRSMAEALAAAAAGVGARVTRVEYYDPAAADLSPVVKRLADYDRRAGELEAQRRELRQRDDELGRQALRRLEGRDTIGDVEFDALLLPAAGEELQKLAALLPYYDIDPARVKMLGTWQWEQQGIGAEPALAGGWFAGTPREQRLDFEKSFGDLYKRTPHRLATLAFDATALAVVLAQQAGTVADRRAAFARAKLTSPNGFAGVDGIFRLLPSGEAERGLAVLEVNRAGFKVLSPAPQSFQPAVN